MGKLERGSVSSSPRGSVGRRGGGWPVVAGARAPAPQTAELAFPGPLALLLEAFDELQAIEQPQAMLRRAIVIARHRIGLERVAISLLDRRRNLMLGTWGCDLAGHIVDESQVISAVSDSDRQAFRRCEQEGAHVTVFESCPILEHRAATTRVAGRGWVAYTPIRSARARIGMLYNDVGISTAPVDEAKQAQVAIICSLLGTLLDPIRGLLIGGRAGKGESYGRLVRAAVAMLAKDASLGGKEIAAQLDISPSRLARVFKTQVGMSMVEYRNRLRLDRFAGLLEGGRADLQGTALAAGFGSYAQFHRVFRALRGTAPRQALRADHSWRGTNEADTV